MNIDKRKRGIHLFLSNFDKQKKNVSEMSLKSQRISFPSYTCFLISDHTYPSTIKDLPQLQIEAVEKIRPIIIHWYAILQSMIAIFLLQFLMAQSTVLQVPDGGGCQQRCGEVDIPYPFGIGENCSFSKEFQLFCNNSFNPPRPNNVLDIVQVVDIKLSSAQVQISLNTMSYSCSDASNSSPIWWIDLSNRPFTFSYTDNVFMAVGCNTTAVIKGSRGQIFGCTSECSATAAGNNGSCSGSNGCCQTTIPNWLKDYYPTEIQRGVDFGGKIDFNPCSYSFVAEKNSFNVTPSDLNQMDINREFPVVLDWVIGNETCVEAKKSDDFACVSDNSYCVDSINGQGYVCNCSQGFRGNPYLLRGCEDINECEDEEEYPCKGTCINKPGSYDCVCPEGTTGDPTKGNCDPIPSKSHVSSQPVILVPVVVASTLVAIALTVWIFSLVQKRKLTKLKLKYFLQNGGSILERRISSAEGIDQSFKIFTMEEVKKATNNYDQSLILGRGGQGVVYQGIIPNENRTVAIKKSTVVDGTQIEQFVNEIAILSQINHRNVVKLLGCCLEVEHPLLVYEFVPNGTLSQHIHIESSSPLLPWEIRLRIAAETSGAIAYLHSSVSVPIIHRDIKSSNILLDLNFTAKVSDFGASRLIPVNDNQVTTLVRGTLGYLDPEYLQTHHLTDKSDVYSFGIVLVELLTGRKVFSFNRTEEEQSLALVFTKYMDEKRLIQILDERVVDSGLIGQMEEVAAIARRCLCLRGEDRPPMVEVAMELEGLRRSVIGNNKKNNNDGWISELPEEVQCLLDESATLDDDVDIQHGR